MTNMIPRTNYDPPLNVSVVVHNSDELRAIYAALAGASVGALATAGMGGRPSAADMGGAPLPQGSAGAAVHQHGTDTLTGAAALPAAGAEVATGADGIDAHGHPWSDALHASTKSKTKEGLWRMKVGVSRPDPLPGFPKDGAAGSTGTSTASTGGNGTGSASTAGAAEEEDEFAAFRTAMDKDNAAGAAAAASAPARKWTDADLGALCNQAAVKLNDPAPVKELISRHVPDGTVAHSRNIPDDKRHAFASAVEERAGIKFAG